MLTSRESGVERGGVESGRVESGGVGFEGRGGGVGGLLCLGTTSQGSIPLGSVTTLGPGGPFSLKGGEPPIFEVLGFSIFLSQFVALKMGFPTVPFFLKSTLDLIFFNEFEKFINFFLFSSALFLFSFSPISLRGLKGDGGGFEGAPVGPTTGARRFLAAGFLRLPTHLPCFL